MQYKFFVMSFYLYQIAKFNQKSNTKPLIPPQNACMIKQQIRMIMNNQGNHSSFIRNVHVAQKPIHITQKQDTCSDQHNLTYMCSCHFPIIWINHNSNNIQEKQCIHTQAKLCQPKIWQASFNTSFHINYLQNMYIVHMYI